MATSANIATTVGENHPEIANRLLIIDDDDDFRHSLYKSLQSISSNIDIDMASSPEEAIRLLQQNNYQVIITDIHHHGSSQSGDTFILQNRDSFKNAEVIVLSGAGSNRIRRIRELEEMQVPILEKGDHFVKLTELIKQRLQEVKESPQVTESDIIPGFELIHTINEEAGWIGQISWSPDGKRIVAQTSEKGVLRWDSKTENSIFIHSEPNPGGGVTWSPDGNTLAFSSKTNILLWNENNKAIERTINSLFPDRLNPNLSWSPDGKVLAIANREGIIQLYSTDNWSPIKSLKGGGDWILALAWSPNHSILASGGDDNVIKLWDINTGSSQDIIGHTNQITCLAWSPNGDLLASGSADKSICIWDPLRKIRFRILEGHTARITSISFSFDGTLLASKSTDGTIKLWRTDNWELVTTIDEPAEVPGGFYPVGIAFNPHDMLLATLGKENSVIRIWRLKLSTLLKPDEESILSASVSDQPTEIDSLGFTPYVKAIARFLTDERTQPPLTLSIEGEWGCGKSSFMLQLEDELRRSSQQQRVKRILKFRWIIRIRKSRVPTPIRKRIWWGKVWPLIALPREERYLTFNSVRFNAWRHDKDSSLWASFAVEFLRKLSKELPLRLRIWTYLKLIARRFKWKDGWMVALRTMIVSLIFAALSLMLFYFLYSGGIERILGESTGTKVEADKVFLILIKGSGIVGYLAVFFYLLTKLKDLIGNPFTSDLKKYIKAPSYDSQITFIEQFHEDFGKIVETYAGRNKVYVFIDDLDRCEVPKAADLMQAINLLISDSPQIFFIVGMDREKVAAGLAVKYEKLLPYLNPPISSERSPRDVEATKHSVSEKVGFDPSSGLEFGYSFIEKFIQIPFRIPQPVELGLKALLDHISPILDGVGESGFIESNPAIQRGLPSSDTVLPPQQIEASSNQEQITIRSNSTIPISSTSPSDKQEERRERIRLTVTRDSLTVRNIVQMVAPALDYNPRRVKQFINMFRLKALIAAETGLFDVPLDPSKDKGLTLQQLGKFVAISLKWPRLLTDLDEDNTLLGQLQNWACMRDYEIDNPTFNQWIQRSQLKQLLGYGCIEEQDPFEPKKLADHARYSLTNINLEKLLRISPQTRANPGSLGNS